MKELKEIRNRLKEKAEREATKLWRMARNAEKHGCSSKLVHEIREEANWLYDTATAYQDRLIFWEYEYKRKYAFR